MHSFDILTHCFVSLLPRAFVRQYDFDFALCACFFLVSQVMMGGAWFHEAFGDPEGVSEQKLLERATQAVASHLGVKAAPVWSLVALLKVRGCERREERRGEAAQ